MRILYIEDEPSNLALLDRVTQMSGDTVVSYPTAEEALHEADFASFDVIVTDIHLGENAMDGLDFTERLRNIGINVPIIAITAYDFDEYARRSSEVGSDYYIVKPVSPTDLVSLLDELRN
jgi:CheY-like chemotaxis protein